MISGTRLAAVAVSVVLVALPLGTIAQTFNAAQDEVFKGIPAIAKAFAPIAGVNWREFAQVLAGICSVESSCNPTYKHVTQGGVYSQYQGLFQMNAAEVSKAEQQLTPMLQQMQQRAQSSPTVDGYNYAEAYEFVRKAVEQAGTGGSADRRFYPAYGIIIGAVKHIQINKQLATQFPGDPISQASGHLTAQFSGITENKIRNGQFGAPVSGSVTQSGTEAWALGLNRVQGQGLTVLGAIRSARDRYASRMTTYINRMSQVTGDMSLVPPNITPFTPPAYEAGGGPLLGVPHSGVSAMMEAGLIPRIPASSSMFSPSLPASVANAARPVQGAYPTQPGQTGAPNQGGNGAQGATTRSAMHAIVQPQSVTAGGTVLVSWTSVGMKSGSCVVGIKGTSEAVARTSEGSQSFRTPSNAESNKNITFELICQTSAGETVATEASVGIQ